MHAPSLIAPGCAVMTSRRAECSPHQDVRKVHAQGAHTCLECCVCHIVLLHCDEHALCCPPGRERACGGLRQQDGAARDKCSGRSAAGISRGGCRQLPRRPGRRARARAERDRQHSEACRDPLAEPDGGAPPWQCRREPAELSALDLRSWLQRSITEIVLLTVHSEQDIYWTVDRGPWQPCAFAL